MKTTKYKLNLPFFDFTSKKMQEIFLLLYLYITKNTINYLQNKCFQAVVDKQLN